MKNIMIFIILLMVISNVQPIPLQTEAMCSCSQIIIQSDCIKLSTCIWNPYSSLCEIKLRVVPTTTNTTTTTSTNTSIPNDYCQQFAQSDCINSDGCGWVLNKCVPFTSCSTYPFQADDLCQSISKKCITDGIKCIQIGACTSYLTKISCSKSDVAQINNLCYWDESESVQQCVEANSCMRLPKYLNSDAQCRKLIQGCTVNPTGGCINTGANCSDHSYEIQCYWDEFMIQECAWNGSECKNKSCESAPQSRNTDTLCKQYLPNCTTKQDGGCQERLNCIDFTFSGACITNAAGGECFWYDNKCFEKSCETAPQTYTTLSECQQFMTNCIQKLLGGCKTMTQCSDGETQDGCQFLNTCFWDVSANSCKLVTCANAPTTLTTFANCIQFKSTCTLSLTGKGCAERTCDNAPTSAEQNIKTNYDCNQYLTGCITKQGGGCRTNTTCDTIDIETACAYDAAGNECFWLNSQCRIKSCVNAPTTLNSHQQCQEFLKTCTVNRNLIGCTDMECQVIDKIDNCKSDKSGNRCYWVGLCFDKTCENAPLTIDFNTDSKCKAYLAECTVSNSGYGCMKRLPQCAEYRFEGQCVNNSYGAICAWISGACHDKACFTAPLTSDFDTYEECQAYLPTCTVRSDGVGGCATLNDCNTYTAARSCRFNGSGGVCELNGIVCADKACETAPQTSSYNDNTKCDTYKSGCIVSGTGQGCVAKPTICSGMSTATQCTATSTNASGGKCAWIGSCVDRQCSSAPSSSDYDTHSECFNFLDTCTVQATGTGGCLTQLGSCPSYTSIRQCELITGGGQCGWYNNSCTTRSCFYAPDSVNYNDDTKCKGYLSTCTVVRRIGGNGCTIRNTGCQNLSQYQCITDSTGILCTWDTTAATPYCKTRICTFTIGISSFTTINCAAWKPDCVSDNSGTGCFDKQTNCSTYTTVDNCQVSSSGTICYWNGSVCSNRTCSTNTGITDFDHTACFNWMNTCTVGKPTNCADKPATCAVALNYDQCYFDINGIQCAWVGTACVNRTCTNHGYAVTNFTNTNCKNWMASCANNPGSTACETIRTCTNHGGVVTIFNHTNCVGWLSSCTNNGSTACIDKTCINHGSNVTVFSSSNCSNWLSTCTNNATSTACVTNRTCTNYGSNVTVFNYTNCNNWLADCTNNGNSSCTVKTCFNYVDNVHQFTHTDCNNWYNQCTVSPDGFSCQQKNCLNHGSNVTVFDNTNCQAWLPNCTVNSTGSGCMSTRTCTSVVILTNDLYGCEGWSFQCKYYYSNVCQDKTCTNQTGISYYSHVSCQNWLPDCTYYNTGSCTYKTCLNYGQNILSFTHQNCQSWLFQCTINSTGDGCEAKTCTNHGSNVTTFNNVNCANWLTFCSVNGTADGCQESMVCSSAALTVWTHTFCEQYASHCTKNSNNSCIDKSCTNYSSNVTLYTHDNCYQWLSTCTQNIAGSACTNKTCTNYGSNISSITHVNCNAWLNTCTANTGLTKCEDKTCTNHGSNVTTFDNTNCQAWLSYCDGDGSKCVNTRTCSNHSIATINHANCSAWLDTCTNSGSSSCVDKTCTNHSSNISKFNHENCNSWLSTCTVNYNGQACANRTCSNYEDNITTFTNTTCSSWAPFCTVNSTNDGCISTKTCTNYGTAVTIYTHTNCIAWLSSCTADSGSTACIDKTCTNYDTNVTTFNHTNCNNWLSSCTVNGSACVDKNCTNHGSNITTFNVTNCYNWYSYCTVNDSGNACVSTKTCTNHGTNVTTFTHANCSTWLNSCTVNAGGTACEIKSCANASVAAITSFTYNNCQTWINSCTINAGGTACEIKTCDNANALSVSGFTDNDCNTYINGCTANSGGTACELKVCANAPASIGTKDSATCQGWLSSCTGDNTDCLDKTCANYSGSFTALNCNNWLNTCSSYSPYSSCEIIRTCASYSGTFDHTSCNNWLSTCTVNSGTTACEEINCTNYGSQVTTFSHANCSSWKSTCTNSTSSTCIDKTCSIGYVNHTQCNSWLTDCTVNNAYNYCEPKNCTNYKSQVTVFNDNTCSAWLSRCILNDTKNGCIGSCTNHGGLVTTFNHTNCYNWDTSCTTNSGNTACEMRTCSNYGANVTTFNNSNCQNWLNICTNSGSTCVQRDCYNYGSNVTTYNHSTCNSWFSDCTANTDNTGCAMKTCDNHQSNVTTFTDVNCSNWLSYCVANYQQNHCKTTRTCINHGANVTVFNHYNCSQWLSTCTVNTANNACENKSCSNSRTQLPSITHINCTNWKSTCTNNSTTGCQDRNCFNYGSNITSFTDANCGAWLSTCQLKVYETLCETRSCLNTGVTTFNQVNCANWLSYCTTNNAGGGCYTTRTCSNHGIYVTDFNHNNCEQWLSSCTVNTAGNGCELKTCYNYKTQVTSYTNTNCKNWWSLCRANTAGDGCEQRTCKNYAPEVTYAAYYNCRAWMETCYGNYSYCYVQSRTCSSTNYQNALQVFDTYSCASWLSTCVPNTAQTACIDRTCTNHGTQITTFNHANCFGWLSTCTVNSGGSACEIRTCTNHAANVTVFNHSNCSNWLSTCTVNTGSSACILKTCTNHGSNVTSFSSTNCTNWLSTCTNDIVSKACEPKNCDNHSSFSYNQTNCQNWLSYCYVNPLGGSCLSLRTCTNHGNNVTTFNDANCSDWLYSCTVNSGNNACIDRTCDNYGTNVTIFNNANCAGWLSTCTVSPDGTKCEKRTCTNHGSSVTSFITTNCQNWLSTCKQAPTTTACEAKTCTNHSTMTINHTNCYNWLSYCTSNADGSECDTLRTCTNHGSIVTVFNHANCQSWLSTCTVNSGGTACIDKTCTNFLTNISSVNHNNCQNWMFSCTANGAVCEPKSCTNYGSNVVVYNHTNCNTWLSTCTADSTGSNCEVKNCSFTVGISTWTHANCENWKSTCQLNKPITCTNLQSNCSNGGVSYNQCQVDTNKDNCVWYNGSCTDRTCGNYTGITFTHGDCETWFSSCTVDNLGSHAGCVTKPTSCTAGGIVQDQCVSDRYGVKCVWTTNCQARSCANYTGAFTHSNCETWLSTCTVDSLSVHAACTSKLSNCSSYVNVDQCIVNSSGVICFWTGTACIDRSCTDATQSSTYDDDTKCKNFLATCTVARVGECMTKLTNCSDYKQESQCFNNLSGGRCFWNTITSLCADITCLNAPTSKTTHDLCNAFLNTCTVNTTINGCINLNQCVNYSIEAQCVISNTGQVCAYSGGQCYTKSCSTAASDSTRNDHTKCQAYLPICTVIATGLGGCVPLANCNTYTTERQCVINASSLSCGWNGTRCDDKSCLTAPPTIAYSSDATCEGYLSGCTVVATGTGGCLMRSSNCSNYTTQRQCVKTITNQLCYWDLELTIPKCVIKTCQNPPNSARTPALCESHFNQCYSDNIYCRLELCEDMKYTTDDDCRKLNPKCTSDGTQCIQRKLCSDAPTENACITDLNNNQCAWVLGWSKNYCSLRNCTTAPYYYITEQDCQQYYPEGNCTTKKGGGCITKSTCSESMTIASCTTSISNVRCVWQFEICRDEICDDFTARSDAECNNLKSGCITNGISCTSQKQCIQFNTQLACRKGLDGPCLWFQDSCILFTGCTSITSKSHDVCQLASTSCTTNGTTCVGLSVCNLYSIPEACIKGTDGDCIWDTINVVCKRFLTCYDLSYPTHNQCYTANPKCTTDGKSCIPLLGCASYVNEDQCKISAVGKLTITNPDNSTYVSQTGYCSWTKSSTKSFCQDQICEDLVGETHSQCASLLKGCTSNGFKCITIAQCSTYIDVTACLIAQGTEGPCQYSQYFPIGCRGLSCSDIVINYSHEVCQAASIDCISNGSQCISKDICINYKNQYSCQFGGQDGYCAWTGSACKLMTACEDASVDVDACQRYINKCQWVEATSTTTKSSCIAHTCESKWKLGICNYILSFDELQLTVCSKVEENCVEVVPTKLQIQECFTHSYSLYAWNPIKQTCSPCLGSSSAMNNSTPNTTQTVEVAGMQVILTSLGLISLIIG